MSTSQTNTVTDISTSRVITTATPSPSDCFVLNIDQIPGDLVTATDIDDPSGFVQVLAVGTDGSTSSKFFIDDSDNLRSTSDTSLVASLADSTSDSQAIRLLSGGNGDLSLECSTLPI